MCVVERVGSAIGAAAAVCAIVGEDHDEAGVGGQGGEALAGCTVSAIGEAAVVCVAVGRDAVAVLYRSPQLKECNLQAR